MRMVRVALAASLGAAGLLLSVGARADVSSTHPAGMIVFPSVLTFAGDTEIQISNTSPDVVHVRCYLVNANSHCSNAPSNVCTDATDCGGGICLPGWTETDFRFTLTKFQPIMWRLSQGLSSFPLDGLENVAQDGQFNVDSNIPPAPEVPFQGELKCFQVDGDDNPVARNDLKGEATFVFADEEEADAAQYNAIGIQATQVNDGNDTLCLGGTEPTDDCPEPEYNGCPNVLILDHFFEDAPDPVGGDRVMTLLNLVPCSENFLNQATVKTTVQFLVFNEFEQRFSTSRRIDCFFFSQLADIDTRDDGFIIPRDRAVARALPMNDDQFSIFSVDIQGTLTGQTRMRPVQTSETDVGHGLLGVAYEVHRRVTGTYTAAFQLDQAGLRDQGDIVRAPRQ